MDGGKGKALFTSTKDWMESSSESEGEDVNYALVASFEETQTTNDSSTPKVQESIYNFDIDDMYKFESFLRSLYVSFKTQTLENTRLRSEIDECKKRNDFLESELVVCNELKNDFKIAKNSESMFRLKYHKMEKELVVEK